MMSLLMESQSCLPGFAVGINISLCVGVCVRACLCVHFHVRLVIDCYHQTLPACTIIHHVL